MKVKWKKKLRFLPIYRMKTVRTRKKSIQPVTNYHYQKEERGKRVPFYPFSSIPFCLFSLFFYLQSFHCRIGCVFFYTESNPGSHIFYGWFLNWVFSLNSKRSCWLNRYGGIRCVCCWFHWFVTFNKDGSLLILLYDNKRAELKPYFLLVY